MNWQRTLDQETHAGNGQGEEGAPGSHVMLVRLPGHDDRDHEGNGVWWYSEELCAKPLIAETEHNRRREERDARERHRDRDVDEIVQVQPPVGQRVPRLRPGDLRVPERRNAFDTLGGEVAFLVGEPGDCLREVREEEEDEDRTGTGWRALEEEEPSPCFETADPVHVADAIRDGTTECSA